MAKKWKRWWRYSRALSVPILLWALVAVTLWEPIKAWLEGSKSNDEQILTEWIHEARGLS